MREELTKLEALVSKAESLPLMLRAGVAMEAVKTATALLGQAVERIEQLERREAYRNSKGGENGQRRPGRSDLPIQQ